MAARRTAALLVEDDARLGAMVAEYLGRHDLDVTVAPDGERGLAALRRGRFDVVLLDVMLPGIDGLEVCRRLRATPEWAALPVLMLTARGEDVDKIVGLELGADDYLAKPFNPRELLARIRAVLRRGAADAPPRPPRASAGSSSTSTRARSRWTAGASCSRTTSSSCWPRWRGRTAACSRASSCWTRLRGQDAEAFDRSIDVHVSKLRAKLEKDPRSPRYIKTVRGVGYVLVRPGPGR